MTDTNTGRTGQFEGQSSGQGGYSSCAGSHSMRERPSDAANEAAGYASRAASALASEAQEKAKGILHQQMQAGADYVRTMSDTAHTAARELEDKAPELARWMHDAAGRVERFAEDMRHRTINDVFDQAASFARNNPRVFFGGAVALGFMLTRFAKSSAQHAGADHDKSSQRAPGSGASAGGVASTTDPAGTQTTGGATYAR